MRSRKRTKLAASAEAPDRTHDQVKFSAPAGSSQRYAEIAERWGYEQFAPFVRRLIDAAAKGDPASGMIQFFRGSDSQKSAA